MLTMRLPRPSAPLLAAAALVLGLVAAPSVPQAQDGSVQALSQQIERLQREVQVLQRQVAVGQPTAGMEVPEGQAGPLLLRLNSLETELRRLTGRVEELSYRLDRLDNRFSTVEAQLDTRIGALENAPAAATGGGRPLMQGQEEGGVRVLGTMPESAAGQQGSGQGAGQGGGQTAAPQASQPVESAAAQQAALPPVDLPGTSAQDDYEYAFGLLRQADYPRAEAALSAFLEAHPDSELAGNAKYWLGETHYVRGDYQTAAVVFAEGFKEYPESNKAPDNLLKLGMALSNLGSRDDACKTYQALLARYPNAAATIRQRADRERGRLGC